LTYNGQGVRKRGVHAEHHAIIYSGKKPVAFRGEKEKGLQMRSIKVSPDNPRHKLDDASRLNYAKTYTVEYNVKVVSPSTVPHRVPELQWGWITALKTSRDQNFHLSHPVWIEEY
jgi:hypothetical protein